MHTAKHQRPGAQAAAYSGTDAGKRRPEESNKSEAPDSGARAKAWWHCAEYAQLYHYATTRLDVMSPAFSSTALYEHIVQHAPSCPDAHHLLQFLNKHSLSPRRLHTAATSFAQMSGSLLCIPLANMTAAQRRWHDAQPTVPVEELTGLAKRLHDICCRNQA